MKKLRRERNPLSTYGQGEAVEYDKALVSPEWGSKEGDESGYNSTYGPFGSAARGWVDRPHDRGYDLQDKILRERFVTDPESHEEEEEYGEEQGVAPVNYSGRGPKNHHRSDDSLREEISEQLMRSPDIDASELEVEVKGGDVTISGNIPTRQMKHWTEDLVEDIRGVKNLVIKIKVTNHNKRQMI